MKKIIILFAVLGLFGSCAFIPDYTWMPPAEIDTLARAQELMRQVKNTPDEGLGNWKLPENTYLSMKGDCEDQAGLLASIMIYNLKYEDVKLVGCINKETNTPHILVFASGQYFESFNGELLKDFSLIYSFTIFISFVDYVKLAQII